MQQHNITKKKFYGKWLYKSTLKIPGIAILRVLSLDDAIDFLSRPHTDKRVVLNLYKKALDNDKDMIDLCCYLKSLNIEDWYKRIERDNIDLYTNDSEIFKDLINKFQHILYLKSEPDLSRKHDYDNGRHIVCKKLPHDRYRYKIFLKPHKMRGSNSAKHEYINWLENQKNVLITQSVKDWFIRTDWNWDPRYMLVEDHKTLLFLHMRNAEVLGRTYEYVLSDK